MVGGRLGEGLVILCCGNSAAMSLLAGKDRFGKTPFEHQYMPSAPG